MRHRLDIDTFREIGDSLFRNKRRTILTGFGIFWGLFMLLFLVGGGQFLYLVLRLGKRHPVPRNDNDVLCVL